MRTAFSAFTLAALAFGQAPPATPPRGGVVSAGAGNPYARAAQLPARILRFTADSVSDSVSIKPGQSVTLAWATENQSGTTLEPGLGTVTARGTKLVTPAATTTYTLSVRGPNNQVITRELKIIVAGTTEVTAASRQRRRKSLACPMGSRIFPESTTRSSLARFFREGRL